MNVELSGGSMISKDLGSVSAAKIRRALESPDLSIPDGVPGIPASQVPPASDTATNPPDYFAQSTFKTAPQTAAGLPIISTLTVTKYGNKFRMDVDQETRSRWPRDCSVNVVCTMQDDSGQWVSAPCDWVKPLPNVKTLECLCICDNDKRTQLPKRGQMVGITLTTKCRHGMKPGGFRSSTAWLVCDWTVTE